jgi:hypothetical protein
MGLLHPEDQQAYTATIIATMTHKWIDRWVLFPEPIRGFWLLALGSVLALANLI